MGLDQFGKRYTKENWEAWKKRNKQYYETVGAGDEWDYDENPDPESTELAYWRKHPYLQGWMEALWEKKGRPNFEKGAGGSFGDFNCVPVELTLEDLGELETAVREGTLPETQGFFFGTDSCEEYKKQDLEFIEAARQAISEGDVVVYDSWW